MTKAADAMSAVAERLRTSGPKAARRARDWSGEMPASGEGRGPTNSVSDPTGRAASSGRHTIDLAAELDRAITEAYSAVARLGALLATLEPLDGHGVTWCPVMLEAGVREPATRRVRNGRKRLIVSPWAARWLKATGRLPTKAEAEAHAQGRKPRRPSAQE